MNALPAHLDPNLPDEDDAAFVARATRALEASRLANDFVDHEVVVARLQAKLDAAKKLLAERAAARQAVFKEAWSACVNS